MVTVVENPDTVATREIIKHRSIIQKALGLSECSLYPEYLNKDVFHGILETREYRTIKSKWPFIKPKEETVGHQIGKITFELSTMSIFLTGNEDELVSIAQKLEDVGYNVTIWV